MATIEPQLVNDYGVPISLSAQNNKAQQNYEESHKQAVSGIRK